MTDRRREPSGRTSSRRHPLGWRLLRSWRRPGGPGSADADRRTVVIWSRVGCHLCEEMAAQVRAVAERDGLQIDLIVEDLDRRAESEPELLARYHELVPVLVVDGVEVGHWRLTGEQVRAALRSA